MTEFDKRLIEKAQGLMRYDYWRIDEMIAIADTKEAKQTLRDIRIEKKDLVMETIF